MNSSRNSMIVKTYNKKLESIPIFESICFSVKISLVSEYKMYENIIIELVFLFRFKNIRNIIIVIIYVIYVMSNKKNTKALLYQI
ncbi:hypothetical protein GCM10027036_00220 [Flavihumibacter cheonanensis]